MKIIFKTLLALLLVSLLLASFAACGTGEGEKAKTNEETKTLEEMKTDSSASSLWDTASYENDCQFGSGEKTIKVQVIAEGKSITFTILTNEENLAAAMLAHNLLEGEDGPYGLYIKKVNGILADYDVNQSYWSLEQNGTALMTGASQTEIADGEEYEFRYAK